MRLRAILVLALAAAVLLGWWLLANSDERRIRRLFDQVSHELEKTGPENPFQELSKAKALARHVGARLVIEGLGGRRDLVLDHETLPQQIALFRRELQTFSVSFDQLTVTVAEDTANKALTASVSYDRGTTSQLVTNVFSPVFLINPAFVKKSRVSLTSLAEMSM